MYNCIHGNAPSNLSNSVIMACDVHTINTRLANTLNVHVPECQTEVLKKSFIYRASIIWNKLPEELKNCKNLNTFKYKVKTYFTKNC